MARNIGQYVPSRCAWRYSLSRRKDTYYMLIRLHFHLSIARREPKRESQKEVQNFSVLELNALSPTRAELRGNY